MFKTFFEVAFQKSGIDVFKIFPVLNIEMYSAFTLGLS